MQELHTTWGRRLVLTCASILSIAAIIVGVNAISEASAAQETGSATDATADETTGTEKEPVAGKKTRKAKKKRPKVKFKVKVNKRHLEAGEKAVVRGSVRPKGTRRKVVVIVGGQRFKTRTKKSNGKFKVRVTPTGVGKRKLRIRAGGDRYGKGRVAKRGQIIVYRSVHASYFGPGLYGGGLACGGRLSPSTPGVAHKTLPCGTKLVLRYRGRVVHTTVVDRGPFIPGRELDLTTATRNALGMGDLGIVQMSY